jgi:hypothetical protein
MSELAQNQSATQAAGANRKRDINASFYINRPVSLLSREEYQAGRCNASPLAAHRRRASQARPRKLRTTKDQNVRPFVNPKSAARTHRMRRTVFGMGARVLETGLFARP